MENIYNEYIFHWSRDKAIYIGGHSLLWDARCSGIYIGVGVALIWHIIFGRKAHNFPAYPILLANTVMFAPMFVDLFTVWLNFRVPSNEIRLLTGIYFGGAFSIYLYPAFISFVTPSKNEGRPAINSISVYFLFLIVNLFIFALKELNNIAAFYILHIFSASGFISLVLIFSVSFLKGLLLMFTYTIKAFSLGKYFSSRTNPREKR